jgi:hypothetical protein
MEIGETVTYVDPMQKEHRSLITAVHGSGDSPSINLVYTSDDPAKYDPYGRQLERATSVVHQTSQMAKGNYWF